MSHPIRRLGGAVVTIVGLAALAACVGPASGQVDGEAAPIFPTDIPHATCLPCHQAVRARDLVFTPYAP